MEEALIEMYLAGVSVRRAEDITEALWGSKVSPPSDHQRGEQKKRMSTLKIGATGLYKVDAIRMSMWMGSICGETGAESMRM